MRSERESETVNPPGDLVDVFRSRKAHLVGSSAAALLIPMPWTPYDRDVMVDTEADLPILPGPLTRTRLGGIHCRVLNLDVWVMTVQELFRITCYGYQNVAVCLTTGVVTTTTDFWTRPFLHIRDRDPLVPLRKKRI